jgi:tetratricopeptide (TPR) repeat protein
MRFIPCGALLLGSLLSVNSLLALSPPARKDSGNAEQAVSKLLAAADDQLNKQRWDDAISTCNDALRLKPGNFEALSKRALAWSQKGDIDKALNDYESALKIKPASPIQLALRSGLYVKKRRFDLAMRDLTAAIAADPKFAMAYGMRGDLSFAMLNFPRAIADMTEAIKLDPTDAHSYFIRARAYNKSAGTSSGPGTRTAEEDYLAAVRDLKQAVKLDPKLADGFNQLAWLQATCPEVKARDGRSAVANALKACDLAAYKNAGYLDTLAAAYAEAGDFDNAVTWQYGAIELAAQSNKPAMQQRAKAYEQRQPFHEKPNSPPPDSGPLVRPATSSRTAEPATGPADWVLLYGRNQFSASPNFPGEVRAKLAELSAKGAEIKCLSFSSRGWVILFDKYDFFARNIPKGAETALRAVQAGDAALKQIAFTPDDGWVVLAQGNHIAHGDLPSAAETAIVDLMKNQGAELKWIAFASNGGWAVLYNKNDYFQRDIPDGMLRALERWKGESVNFKSAAFAPSGEWIILFDANGAWSTCKGEALKSVIDARTAREPFKSMAFPPVPDDFTAQADSP